MTRCLSMAHHRVNTRAARLISLLFRLPGSQRFRENMTKQWQCRARGLGGCASGKWHGEDMGIIIKNIGFFQQAGA